MTKSNSKDQLIVGLMGASLGTGNRGVSALSASVINLFANADPNAQVSLLIGNRTNEPFELRWGTSRRAVPVVNYRMSFKSGLGKHIGWILFLAVLYRLIPLGSFRRSLAGANEWIGFMAKADLILDIRGGDSFSDIYGLRNFIAGSLGVISAILIRGRIGLLPQTYGPFKSNTARRLAAFILRHASPILSRDLESITVVQDLIGKSDRCVFCPDVAFSLEKRPPEKLAIQPPLASGDGKNVLIGLNVNGLMFRGGYTRANMFGLKMDYPAFVVSFLKAVLAIPGTSVLLIPHTFSPPESVESDPQACREVRAALPAQLQSSVHMLENEYDQGEVKAVIGKCQFFVGSRMHACIAALSQGIPTVGVAYSKKFIGVFESVGAAEAVVDGRRLDGEQAVARALEMFASRDAIAARLVDAIAAAQAVHASVFRDLIDSVRIPGGPAINAFAAAGSQISSSKSLA